jgi:hypothetical protein
VSASPTRTYFWSPPFLTSTVSPKELNVCFEDHVRLFSASTSEELKDAISGGPSWLDQWQLSGAATAEEDMWVLDEDWHSRSPKSQSNELSK